MGTAFKCALMGTLGEGDGENSVDVMLDDKRMIRAQVFVKTNPQTFMQGVFGPEAAAKVKAALEALRSKKS